MLTKDKNLIQCNCSQEIKSLIYIIDNILKEDLKRTHFKKCFLNKKRKKPDYSNDEEEEEDENETKNKGTCT